MAEPARKLDSAQPQQPPVGPTAQSGRPNQPASVKPAAANGSDAKPIAELKIKSTLKFKPGRVIGSIGPAGRNGPASVDSVASTQGSDQQNEEDAQDSESEEQDPQAEQQDQGQEQEKGQAPGADEQTPDSAQPTPEQDADSGQIPKPEMRGESPYYQGPPQNQQEQSPELQEHKPEGENGEDQNRDAEKEEEKNSEQEEAENAGNQASEENGEQEQGQGNETANAPIAQQLTEAAAVQDPEKAKELAKKAAGTAIVNWLFGFMFTLVFSPIAIIALDIYVFIGFFTSDAVFHQMGMWKKIVLLLFNILLLAVIVLLILIIFYGVCSGLSGFVIKVLGFFSSQFSFCSELQKAGVLP